MKSKILIFLGALLTGTTLLAAPPLEEGKAIFNARCAGCHNVNKIVAGPALAGVHERRSMDWIVKFVQSSQAVIKSGDKDAVALFEKFNKIPMPDHTDLTEEKIKSVVDFIKAETSTTTSTAPFAKPAKLVKAYTPLAVNDYAFWGIYLFAVFMLIMGLVLAVHVKSLQRESVSR
ncbi:MAG TPA: cytochrome c [Flavisolibacter sp.]